MVEARVAQLWRYPVKSLQGESLEDVEFLEDGVAGDRGYGILDLGSRTVLSAKRHGGLLEGAARLTEAGVLVELPDGERLAPGADLDARLSAWLGRPSALVRALEHGPGTYEGVKDFEDEGAGFRSFTGPPARFVDSLPVHLLTTASLRALGRERPELAWSSRRFRPNVVVELEGDDLVEEAWLGRRLRLGEVELEVEKSCSRCVMTTRPQPGGLGRELEVLRHLARDHGAKLGVLARVVEPGAVRVGAPVRLAA